MRLRTRRRPAPDERAAEMALQLTWDEVHALVGIAATLPVPDGWRSRFVPDDGTQPNEVDWARLTRRCRAFLTEAKAVSGWRYRVEIVG